jgi:hypothetical protein
MDPKEYLTELGYSNEDITAMLTDEKQLKLITAAAKSYGEGKTLKSQADAEKAETATFWEQKTQELQGSVNRLTAAEKRAATAEAAAAQRTAYLKSLKDQGYDVPDEMIGAPGTHTPDPPKYMTQDDFNKASRATAPDLVSLTALSNEYYHLFGEPYVAVEEDFRAAQQAGKPLRDYARSKYNFDAKKQEKAQKADQERIDKIVNERVEAERAKIVAANGSNGELRSPLPSKFDKLTKAPGFKSDSWKTPDGRAQNRADRLKKFENVTLQ